MSHFQSLFVPFQLVHFFSPLPGCLSPNEACFRGCLFVIKSGCVLVAVCLSPSQTLFSWPFVSKSDSVLVAVCLSSSQALFSWLFVCLQVRLCSPGCLLVIQSSSVLVAVCHLVRRVLVAGCLSPNQAVFSWIFVNKSGCQVIL